MTTVNQQLKNGEINTSIANTVLSHLTEEEEVIEDRRKTLTLLASAGEASTPTEIEEVKKEALSLAEDMSLELSTLQTVLRTLDSAEEGLANKQSQKFNKDLNFYKGQIDDLASLRLGYL